MSKFLIILLFIKQSFLAIDSSICPESRVVFPCICSQTKESLPDLTCSRHDVNVSEVMANIRLNGRSGVHQLFDKLFWTNGRQINITDDFFAGVSFQRIYIGTRRRYANISHISSNAFRGIQHKVKSIVIRSQHLRDEQNLFKALQSLTNVESIGIEAGGIRTVPENAFKVPEDCQPLSACVQKNLKTISFRIGSNESLIFLNEIKSNAFYDLPNLVSIDVNSHDIQRIHKNAFTFGHKSDQLLTINLSKQWNKQFVSNSFDVKSFESTKRPIFLDLYSNRFLTTLSEEVFRPLLESDPRNKIRLGMKMNCNCDMYWLWEGRDRFIKHFIEWSFDDLPETDHKFTILCSEGSQSFWDKNDSDFNECLNNTRIEL